MTDEPKPQHLEALERATYVRTRRAAILRDLRSGDRSVVDAVTGTLDDGDADDLLKPVKVRDVIECVRRVGGSSSGRILDVARVNREMTLGRLSAARRQAVVEALLRVAPWAAPDREAA